MTERSPIITPEPDADRDDRAEARASVRRRPGRPKGTNYRRVDAPLHERMRQLLDSGVVPCRTAAARLVVNLAYGHGCEDSKVRRLVKWFRY